MESVRDKSLLKSGVNKIFKKIKKKKRRVFDDDQSHIYSIISIVNM